MNWDSSSHYEILQVSQSAPMEVIRASYKALVQKYHPDRYAPREEAERATKRLNEAYATLSDSELRELKGFGSKALDEVKDKMAELEL